MARTIFAGLLFICIIQTVHGQDFMLVLFKNKQVCSWYPSKDSIFIKTERDVRKMFFINQITSVIATEDCDRSHMHGLFCTFLKFQYSGDYALQAFDSLVAQSKKSSRSSLWNYNKPGKIYGVNENKKSITVLSMNSCAYGKDFEKLVNILQKEREFAKMLVVPCGADQTSVKVFW